MCRGHVLRRPRQLVWVGRGRGRVSSEVVIFAVDPHVVGLDPHVVVLGGVIRNARNAAFGAPRLQLQIEHNVIEPNTGRQASPDVLLLHPEVKTAFHRALLSPRSGPRLPKPTSPACSTANSGLRTGLRCFFAADLTCLAGRAADCSYLI